MKESTRAYEQLFAGRGGNTPTEPLNFHLYHLARYWSRLLGFCRMESVNPAPRLDGDLGLCIEIGTEFTGGSIDPSHPYYSLWQDYWKRTQKILHERPVTLNDLEAASKALDDFFKALNYDPWSRSDSKGS